VHAEDKSGSPGQIYYLLEAEQPDNTVCKPHNDQTLDSRYSDLGMIESNVYNE